MNRERLKKLAADKRFISGIYNYCDRWYHYFICAKVMRAVRGIIEDEEEEDGQFPKDSDGSAKIALIAIDRSIGA